MYVVLVEVCKGSLIEVVTGMSIIHSLGVILTDSTTVLVERHIMTVDRVRRRARSSSYRAQGKDHISIDGCSGDMQLMAWEGELVVDME